MNLQLEYTCTEKELSDAQFLFSQHQSGGKPKWQAQISYYGFPALILGVYIVLAAPENRFSMIVALAVVVTGLLIHSLFKRPKLKKPPGQIKLEATESELVIDTEYGRTTMPWSAFSLCLESSTVFALVNRAKTLVYTVPKRAFPDEKSQEWFRAIAQLLAPGTASSGTEKVIPDKSATKGITLTVQLRYGDYLNKAFISWAGKAFCLAFVALVVMIYFISTEPPDTEHLRDRASIIPLSLGAAGLPAIFLLNLLKSWRSDKEKGIYPVSLSLSSEGVGFACQNATGNLSWTVYKYHLENRRAFFIWNPNPSAWLILPKREFASPLDIAQCRELLKSNLKPSHFFR